MSYLSAVLNGAKVSNLAKTAKISEQTMYYRIADEILALNRKHGTNLSTRMTDVRQNQDAYRALLNRERPTNKSKSLHELLRFNNPLEAINNLEGDMRIGAIIMYNTLNND